jgi:hypothetical protein
MEYYKNTYQLGPSQLYLYSSQDALCQVLPLENVIKTRQAAADKHAKKSEDNRIFVEAVKFGADHGLKKGRDYHVNYLRATPTFYTHTLRSALWRALGIKH